MSCKKEESDQKLTEIQFSPHTRQLKEDDDKKN